MSSLNNGERAIMAGVKGALTFVTTSDSSDTYTATIAPAPGAYSTAFLYCGYFGTANTTTTPTINFNSIGAATIQRVDGSALGPGDLNGYHLFAYDGTYMRLLNPANAAKAGKQTLASASTVSIGAASSFYVSISGTTAITAFDTVAAGVVRVLEFQGALTLTYNATSLILPGAANITTAAGDIAIAVSEGSGNWRLAYFPASGSSVISSVQQASPGYRNRLTGAGCAYFPFGTSLTVATGTPSLTLSNNNRLMVGHIIGCTGATVTAARATSPFATPRTVYVGKLTGQVGVTDTYLRFVISGADAAQCAGRNCTFQIRVKTSGSASGTPTIATKYAGALDNWSSPTNDLTSTNLQAVGSNSEQLLAYTFAVNASAINGYELVVDFGSMLGGASKAIAYGEWDFSVDTVSTTGLNASPAVPEIPTWGADVERCMERVESCYPNATAPATVMNGTYQDIQSATAVDTGGRNIGAVLPYKVQKRAVPTFAFWDGAGTASAYSSVSGGSWTNGRSVTQTPIIGVNSTLLNTTALSFGSQLFLYWFADADILGA